MCPKDRQAVTDARQAIGNLGEVIFAQLLARDGNQLALVEDRFGAIVKEGAMISG